jgi:hypothetical protein
MFYERYISQEWYDFTERRNTNTGFIRGILRGVRDAKSLRVLFLHRRSPSWTTLVLYSRVVFIFNEPTIRETIFNCVKKFTGLQKIWTQKRVGASAFDDY